MLRISLACVLALAATVCAQDQGREAFRAFLEQADQLDPPRRLGMRSALNTSIHAVIPDVVIVPDEASYLGAIEAWTTNTIFPVLIDDGSSQAREDIARFVRAFEPRRVLRWSDEAALPARGIERRRAIEKAMAGAWDRPEPEPTQAALIDWWLSLDIRPAGIIVADDADPAWTAALALGAARAQPIAWIPIDGIPRHTMTPADAELVRARLEAECIATGLSFDALGDDLDAVTFCQSSPVKIKAGNDVVSFTDAITRMPNAPDRRWAWSSQIFGDGPRAAYMAMSAIFLQPRRAWLFDGYKDEGLFARWDATAAGASLEQRGLEVRVIDDPSASAMMWQVEARRPLDADLIFVNTQGMREYFDVNPGRVHSGSVPMLNRPAIVHFVHSWSAATPDARKTLAARWLERGAFAYYGSVQEPYLQAFIPTPIVAQRLLLGYPWGAAPRIDSRPPPEALEDPDAEPPLIAGQIWRLATFGDPLYVLNQLRRLDVELGLPGASSVEDDMRAQVADERFERVVVDLIMLGRDEDAARLALALLDQNPQAVTPELAAAVIPAVFRAGEQAGVAQLYSVLPSALAADPVLRDVLWLSAAPGTGSSLDASTVRLLRDNLREDQYAIDAVALSGAVSRTMSRDEAIQMLTEARSRASTNADRKAIDARISGLR